MNKSAIRNFAIWARVQLIEAAKQRAYEYEITENGENQAGIDTIGGRLLTVEERKQRDRLIAEIRHKGYTQVMEEAAYTWFNRFIALRYMEVNGFLPSKVRVFTDENGAFKPEILKEAMTVELDGLDRSIVLDLLDKQNNEELYKYLLITQCKCPESRSALYVRKDLQLDRTAVPCQPSAPGFYFGADGDGDSRGRLAGCCPDYRMVVPVL